MIGAEAVIADRRPDLEQELNGIEHEEPGLQNLTA